MKYHVIVFGCQMNISDSERVSAVIESMKYKSTQNIREADLIVVVMCSIRQSAVDRVHWLAHKFKEIRKKKKNLKTVLTGCILKKDKKIFVEGFDYVVDINEIKRIPELLGKKQKIRSKQYLDITPKYTSSFSANIPIMTGCNNFCSYCVVPYTREREISRPAKEIIAEVKNAIKNGCKEFWLLGQNVNSYKNGRTNFPKLLRLINDIKGDFWIRFTSSHPKDFSDELIDAMAECNKVTKYLNLPVQSGDDKILKSMNRHYTIKDYKNKIQKVRKRIPDIAISTDIIIGYSGETKKQFQNTMKLFKEVKYNMAYLNKYSKRAGTAAAKLEDNVSKEEKDKREKDINEILKKTALENNKKLIGKEIVVLVDNKKDKNTYFGKNEGYTTVKIKSSKNILGKFVKVKITEAMSWSLVGKAK